jgi:uncharacterized protein YidB (DUF937 family)
MGDILGEVLGGVRRAAGMGGMGGLGGLLEQFQRMGYGEQASSWVGPGQNQPIPADVIGQIFGQDGLAAIARQAGVSEADVSAGLSQLLPEVVDRVTPNGEVPDLDALTASVSDLSPFRLADRRAFPRSRSWRRGSSACWSRRSGRCPTPIRSP